MARKVKPELAEYECITDCTWDFFTEDGQHIQRLFQRGNGDDRQPDRLMVPAGEIVSQHFQPINEQAMEDRDDQLENPGKYVQTERDVILLAEIMVKENMFGPRFDDQGKLKQSAKAVAMEAIQDLVDFEVAHDNKDREDAIRELLSRATSPKEQRKILNAILKAGEVKGVFPGSDPEKLAALVYDNDLYDSREG